MQPKITENLMWRYATKKFDPKKKISEADFEDLLESLRLAPSSFGLQPWKFLVVTDSTIREKLKEHAWGQPQVTDASHLIVLCVRKDMDENYIKEFVKSIAKTRNVPAESLKEYEDMMINSIKSKPENDAKEWTKKQVYIALGFILSACAQKRIDACPMEGFDREKFDNILGLNKEGLESAVLCAVGYRAGDDNYASAKKVRFAKKDVFIFR